MNYSKKSILCALVLTLILSFNLTASSVSADWEPPQQEKINIIDISKLDKKYVEAAKQAVKKYNNGKTFTLARAFKDKCDPYGESKTQCLYLDSKQQDARVTLDAKTAKVLAISLAFSKEDISKPLAVSFQPFNKAITTAAPPRFQFEQAYFYKNIVTGYEQIYAIDKRSFSPQYIGIEIDKQFNKTTDNSIFLYRVNEVDEDYRILAEETIRQLAPDQAQPFNQVERWKYEDGKVELTFQTIEDEEGDKRLTSDPSAVLAGNTMQSVTIDLSTGKVVSAGLSDIRYYDGSEHAISKAEVVAVATPLVKKVLGVDLSGYTAFFDKKNHQLSFFKKGGVIVIVDFDTNFNIHEVRLGN